MNSININGQIKNVSLAVAKFYFDVKEASELESLFQFECFLSGKSAKDVYNAWVVRGIIVK